MHTIEVHTDRGVHKFPGADVELRETGHLLIHESGKIVPVDGDPSKAKQIWTGRATFCPGAWEYWVRVDVPRETSDVSP